MKVERIEQTAFGSTVVGVQVQMSKEEAKSLLAMLGQGFAHPPMKGINVDYDAKTIGADLTTGIREQLNGFI